MTAATEYLIPVDSVDDQTAPQTISHRPAWVSMAVSNPRFRFKSCKFNAVPLLSRSPMDDGGGHLGMLFFVFYQTVK